MEKLEEWEWVWGWETKHLRGTRALLHRRRGPTNCLRGFTKAQQKYGGKRHGEKIVRTWKYEISGSVHLFACRLDVSIAYWIMRSASACSGLSYTLVETVRYQRTSPTLSYQQNSTSTDPPAPPVPPLPQSQDAG